MPAIAGLLDQELYMTWFNTLARRFFHIRGVDARIEFVALDIDPTDRITHPVARHSYAVWGNLPRICQKILDDYPFAAPYAHAGLCAMRIADALTRRLSGRAPRNTGASAGATHECVGRLHSHKLSV